MKKVIIQNDLIKKIEEFYSNINKLKLADKARCILSKQVELVERYRGLSNIKLKRGYFTNEEFAAVQNLMSVYRQIEGEKRELCGELQNEICKELAKSIMNQKFNETKN